MSQKQKAGKSRQARRRERQKNKKNTPVNKPAVVQAPVDKAKFVRKERAKKIPGAGLPKIEESSGQNMNIPVSTEPVLSNLALAVQGAMQEVVANGFEAWAEGQGTNGAAFYAYVYLTQILFSYSSNTVPQSISVPLWLDVLGCALLPHTINLGQGKISYSFLTDTTYPARLPYNTPALNGSYWLAASDPGGVEVDGFISMQAPATYSEALGQASYQLLCKFISNKDEWPGWVMVASSSSWTLKDPSAYAASWVQLGTGASTISAVLNELMLETALTSPILAKFADWYASTPRRYFRQTRSSGGDANYLGFLLSRETLKRRIKSKVIPKFKQVDFYEYLDVLGFWLASALENAFQNIIIQGSQLMCPLTWQQFAICIRQAIGYCWMPHDLSGQFFNSESSVAGVAFYPFTWGTNCFPSNIASSMLLPRIFIESVRSLQGYMVDLDYVDQRTQKKLKGGMAYCAPTLGIYAEDEPTTQYFFNDDFPVFQPSGEEIHIDLVDFTYSTGPHVPLDANGAELLLLVQTWNTWVTQTIDSNITGLEPIGSDFPPKQLHSLHLTNFVAPVPVSQIARRKKIGQSFVGKSKISRQKRFRVDCSEEQGKKIETRTEIGQAQDNWGVCYVTSQNTILRAVYDNWQQLIVLPSVRTLQSGSDTLTPYDYASLGAAYNEPYSLSTNQAAESILTPYEPLTSRHMRFAAVMTRTSTAPPNTLEIFLDECIKTGRGGSLGSMFGSLAGSFLEKYIPGATQIGGALGNIVGDMVPF